jgi:hypothetical protein
MEMKYKMLISDDIQDGSVCFICCRPFNSTCGYMRACEFCREEEELLYGDDSYPV